MTADGAEGPAGVVEECVVVSTEAEAGSGMAPGCGVLDAGTDMVGMSASK